MNLSKTCGKIKAKSPAARFDVCLPLAYIKRLSEDLVSETYANSGRIPKRNATILLVKLLIKLWRNRG
jgi:hypothetical protein